MCWTQFCVSVALGEYGVIHRPITATTLNTPSITSPAMTLGERGRRRIRALWNVAGA